VGIDSSKTENNIVTHNCTEHRYNNPAETFLPKDSSYINNHKILIQMYSIDIVSDAPDNSGNFMTLQDIRESEMVIDKMKESAERNHIHSIAQLSQHTEDIVSELSCCMHRNNNCKGRECGNNDDNEVSTVDNRSDFETQHMVHSSVKHSGGRVTVIGHMDEGYVNKAEGETPENNNDQESEFKNTGKNYVIFRPLSLVQGNDENNDIFEYSSKSEVPVSSNENSGSMETERTGTVDEIGIDSTNVMNDSEIHLDNTSLFATSSCSDLNTDLAETGKDKGTEISCGQNEHTSIHFVVEALPMKHSCMQDIIPESEDDIHNGKGRVSSCATTNYDNTVDLEQFVISGCRQIKNHNPENHTNENRDIQGLVTLEADLETAKSFVKTLTVHKKSAVHVKSPIVDSHEYSSYGSTSENKNASFPDDKCCNGKNNAEVTKPAKNKKKEASIT
jgi:hypothetical protein